MNQSKLDVAKQEMARVNIKISGINELKWTGMIKFYSDDHYIDYFGQEPPQKNWSNQNSQQEYKMQYIGTISKMTELSLFILKAILSILQQSKSIPEPLMLKKLKLNNSKIYKAFRN